MEDKQNNPQNKSMPNVVRQLLFRAGEESQGKESKQLFDRHLSISNKLKLHRTVEDENGIQKQINAQHWPGCYFEQAMKAKGKESEKLFDRHLSISNSN